LTVPVLAAVEEGKCKEVEDLQKFMQAEIMGMIKE
jgi:hypothetical protein